MKRKQKTKREIRVKKELQRSRLGKSKKHKNSWATRQAARRARMKSGRRGRKNPLRTMGGKR